MKIRDQKARAVVAAFGAVAVMAGGTGCGAALARLAGNNCVTYTTTTSSNQLVPVQGGYALVTGPGQMDVYRKCKSYTRDAYSKDPYPIVGVYPGQ